jgi:hypothetical protein
MQRQKVERRVLLELPGFLGLAAIVSTTDLVAMRKHWKAERADPTG